MRSLAVDGAGEPQVVRVGDLVDRDELGAERAEAGDVLAGPEARARVDLALLRFAVGEVVEDGHAGDVVERLGLLDAERALADDEHQLGLVVEAHDAVGPDHVRLVADQAGVELDEAGRLLRHLLEEVGALAAPRGAAVVLADAEELVGVGHRRQVVDRGFVAPGGVEMAAVVRLRGGAQLAHPRHRVRPGGEQRLHARRHAGDLGDARGRGDVEDAGAAAQRRAAACCRRGGRR